MDGGEPWENDERIWGIYIWKLSLRVVSFRLIIIDFIQTDNPLATHARLVVSFRLIIIDFIQTDNYLATHTKHNKFKKF